MISYSHKDNDICHRIYKTLTARDFRVWIDLEGMHGAVMQVMANAVKQSRCILICMSESYYLSPYSQSEAQFAFEKQRVLIPIKVQSGYKPDGWLAFLTSGRIYVDFMKTDFNAAFDKVVSEIASSRADEKDSSLILLRSNKSETSTIKSQLLPTSSNQSKHLKSRIGRFEDDPAEKNTETGNKQSSLQACVAGLQERVELMDTRFEKINDSLNWIMAAITRVKMAKDNPPYIENPKSKSYSK
ncbi:unnamed protein product [Rotaria magnacalcarata]|uniref:TIR domain-containing protein n=2 Tax=Rotaria magnacalcarata TaxID=392030 RepID=A0A8S2MLZ0_9BILA|nr:unnamed protein product [Rotaria magnacalcarata]